MTKVVLLAVASASALQGQASALKPLLRLRGGLLNPVQLYTAALVSAPVATNVATASALSVVADGLAQTLTSQGSQAWDVSRTAWIAGWGAVVSGYVMSGWFALLSSLYPNARTSLWAFLRKLGTNQLVLSPGLNAGFFAFVVFTRSAPVAWMTATKWAELDEKLRADLLPTCMRSNVYWSCVQTLNFRVLPDSLTVLSTNVFFLFWTVYLCVVGNRKVPKT